MKIAIIGCGYVVDHYLRTLHDHPILKLKGVTDINMSRAEAVAKLYGTTIYTSNEELWADPEVELVVNLTNPESHHEISKASLLAGKHVYTEKPIAFDISQAKELVHLAENRGLLISGAPCNVLSDTIQTMWKAVLSGAVGRVQLVYAEFDANPIYLMKPEGWSSASGAAWPYRNEYEVGCTVEHAGYHLTWLAAMFGPAVSVTAFSSCLVPDKTQLPLDPPDTPDFSVGSIVFQSGVVARLTCSIVAPFNHQMMIIGNEGILSTDTYAHYQSPVYLERFNQLNLNARKARSVRASRFLKYVFGIGGKKLTLVNKPKRSLVKLLGEYITSKPPILGATIKNLKNRELGAQDKLLGIVEMARALKEKRRCLLPADFVVHVTELILAISTAGTNGSTYKVKTTFKPIQPKRSTLMAEQYYKKATWRELLALASNNLIERLHKH